jgi:hypothetical protein
MWREVAFAPNVLFRARQAAECSVDIALEYGDACERYSDGWLEHGPDQGGGHGEGDVVVVKWKEWVESYDTDDAYTIQWWWVVSLRTLYVIGEGDLQESYCEHADQANPSRFPHLQTPDDRHGEKQDHHVGEDVDDTGQNVWEDSVSADATGDGQIPIKGKWPTEQKRTQDNWKTPEEDNDGDYLRRSLDFGNVKNATIE